MNVIYTLWHTKMYERASMRGGRPQELYIPIISIHIEGSSTLSVKSKFLRRSFNERLFIFSNHNKYERLNNFPKFGCNRIVNIEVIKEINYSLESMQQKIRQAQKCFI